MRKFALIIALIALAAVVPPARATDSPQAGDACTTANQVTMNGGAEDSGNRDFLICTANVGTWTVETAAENNWWDSVTYGNGLFVAVANNGTHEVMTSPDGVTWTPRTSAMNSAASVTYGNSLFVAVGSDGSGHYVMTSPDGITWTVRTPAENNPWGTVTYGNGLFVAVTSSGTHRVMTSPDGITWTAQTAAVADDWGSVAYGNGVFVAVSYASEAVMTSPDGVTWTLRTPAEASQWVNVTYANGLFVAVTGGAAMTSPDGITWTAQTVPYGNWSSVAYANGLFVAVATTGATYSVMTSPDGVNWAQQTVPEANNWHSVTYGNGVFVAVSDTGTHRVMISNTTWNSTAHIAAGGNVGIGNTSPGALLDIGTAGTTAGTLRLENNVSGYVQLQPAAAAGSWTATLPGTAGTSGYLLSTNGSGALSWVAPTAGTATTALNSVTAATSSNTIDNKNFAQTWNWNTITTTAALTLSSNSVTTGTLLSLVDSNSAASGGSVLKLISTQPATNNFATNSTVSASSGHVTAVKGVVSGGSPNGIALWGYCTTGATACVQGSSDGAIGTKGYVTSTSLAGAVGVYGQVDSTASGPVGVDGASIGTSGTNYGVYGTDASASGYGGYFTNTGSGQALNTNTGTVILGSAGTAFSNMGVCTVASYTPTNTTTNVTCTGVPASTSVAVTCSGTAAFQTPNTTAIYASATGTANQIAVNLSAANNVAMTLKCAWVQASYGYFVMSKTTYTGSLGGISGADALCLTDLTTNTGWMGYAEANARGLLTSGNVHAFGICLSTGALNNLNPNTQYYFANATDGTKGGASFTTNSSGYGPGDNADWSGASYFGASYNYWSNIGTGTSTRWDGSQCTIAGNSGAECVDFANATAGFNGPYGESASGFTGTNRWYQGGNGCNNTYHLVCFVNP